MLSTAKRYLHQYILFKGASRGKKQKRKWLRRRKMERANLIARRGWRGREGVKSNVVSAGGGEVLLGSRGPAGVKLVQPTLGMTPLKKGVSAKKWQFCATCPTSQPCFGIMGTRNHHCWLALNPFHLSDRQSFSETIIVCWFEMRIGQKNYGLSGKNIWVFFRW